MEYQSAGLQTSIFLSKPIVTLLYWRVLLQFIYLRVIDLLCMFGAMSVRHGTLYLILSMALKLIQLHPYFDP